MSKRWNDYERARLLFLRKTKKQAVKSIAQEMGRTDKALSVELQHLRRAIDGGEIDFDGTSLRRKKKP
jgi:hypothetical protein